MIDDEIRDLNEISKAWRLATRIMAHPSVLSTPSRTSLAGYVNSEFYLLVVALLCVSERESPLQDAIAILDEDFNFLQTVAITDLAHTALRDFKANVPTIGRRDVFQSLRARLLNLLEWNTANVNLRTLALSEEQAAMLPAIRDKWFDIRHSTAQVDDNRIVEAIELLYRSKELEPPTVLVFDSPLSAILFMGELFYGWQPEAHALQRILLGGLDPQPFLNQVVANFKADQILAWKQKDALTRDDWKESLLSFNDIVWAQVAMDVEVQVQAQLRTLVPGQPSWYDLVGLVISEGVWQMEPDQSVFDVTKWLCSAVGQCFTESSPLSHSGSTISFAMIDFFNRACGIPNEALEGMFACAQTASFIFPFKDLAFAARKPMNVAHDLQWRLHQESGPAVKFADGWSLYVWHGVVVPRHMIEEPQSLTVAQIELETNVELRRVMIERYGGQQRFLQDSNATEIHRDAFGVLYRKELSAEEPLVMVEVIDKASQPDGSFRHYFLRVPPTMLRAREAIAWTFGLAENQFAPDIET